jgi:hypothetical protein
MVNYRGEGTIRFLVAFRALILVNSRGRLLFDEDESRGNKRQHNRTPFNARVKIAHNRDGEFLYLTRDVSDSGIFVCVDADQSFPALGSCVKVQMQGLPIPAPVLDMVIVRKGKDGYGLNFLPEQDADPQSDDETE